MHRQIARHLFLVLFVALLAVWVPGAWPHGVTLKIEHPQAEDSPFHTQFLVPWARKIEQESGGRLRIHLYPGMQPGGNGTQFLDRVKDGTVDIAWTGLPESSNRYVALAVFELPFMASERQGWSQALWEYVRLSDRAQMELEGIRLLAIHQYEAPQFHMRAKAVTLLEDLTGAKIATCARAGSKLVAALGATPLEMTGPQITEAFSTGAIDGALLPWNAVPDLKLHESAKFHSETEPKARWLYSNVSVLAMSSATYKSLPEDLRSVIDANSGPETAAWINRVLRDHEAAVRKLAKDRGDAINVLSAEELKRWRKPTQAVVDQWTTEVAKSGINAKLILDAAREARDEYDPVR